MLYLTMNKKGTLDDTSLLMLLGGAVIVHTGFGFTTSATIKNFKASRHLKRAKTYKEKLNLYEYYQKTSLNCSPSIY